MSVAETAEGEVAEAVREAAEFLVRSILGAGHGRVVVEGIPELLPQALTALRDKGVCEDLLSLTVVDLDEEGGGLQLVHHLSPKKEGAVIELWTRLAPVTATDSTKASEGVVTAPSCARLWPSAVWLEREAWEMHGVVFEGHPGLERLLLPSWWVGHPMRRDAARNRTAAPPGAGAGQTPAREDADGWAPVDLPAMPMGGTMRLEVRSKDGKVTAARLGAGLLHRGVEALAEGRTWEGVLPLAARAAVRSSVHWQVAYATAVERLAGLEAPPRAWGLRVALMELERIADHLLSHATVLGLLGARAHAARAWADRELVLDAMQMATGGRVVHDAIAIGGVAMDSPPGWPERLGQVAEVCAQAVREHAEEARGLPEWGRLSGLAPVHPDHMPGWGLSGPLVRASGLAADARADGRAAGYSGREPKVPSLKDGDARARAEVRLLEIASSARLLGALATSMPGGRVREEAPEELPPGRALGTVEDPRGELHCMVVSSGRPSPRRVHFRSPDLAHASALGEVLIGVPVDDVPLAVASVDICVGGVDR